MAAERTTSAPKSGTTGIEVQPGEWDQFLSWVGRCCAAAIELDLRSLEHIKASTIRLRRVLDEWPERFARLESIVSQAIRWNGTRFWDAEAKVSKSTARELWERTDAFCQKVENALRDLPEPNPANPLGWRDFLSRCKLGFGGDGLWSEGREHAKREFDKAKDWLEIQEQPTAAPCRVKLDGISNAPMVKGQPKPKLRRTAYQVVEALVNVWPNGKSKGDLEEISSGFWQILDRLRDSDPDWSEVIHFPGPNGAWKGYRIG